MYSGGRDSTCLLDLAARIAGPPAVSALHVNYGLRAGADADERHCAGVCRALGIQLDVRRPVRAGGDRSPAAATSRRGPATSATARPPTWRWRAAPTSPWATRALTRWRRSSTGWRHPRAGARCSGWSAATARSCARSWGSRASRRAPTAPAHGLRWRDDETNDSDAYARNRIRRELVPALERVHPAAQDNVLALAEILRAEAEVLDELVSATLDGRAGDPAGAPARAAAGAAAPGGAAPGRRCRRAARPPGWPAAPRRWRRCRAWHARPWTCPRGSARPPATGWSRSGARPRAGASTLGRTATRKQGAKPPPENKPRSPLLISPA